jgi:DNA-dependent protein kinase catalytic subunit
LYYNGHNTQTADWFPRLLEILSTKSGQAIGKKIFLQESKKVPCWMFIRWISQMMALLDKEEGPCVMPILTEIARQYPQVRTFGKFQQTKQTNNTNKLQMIFLFSLRSDRQALYFPFRISTEIFAEGASEAVALAIAPLKKLLQNSLLDRFVDSLEKLTNPGTRSSMNKILLYFFIFNC